MPYIATIERIPIGKAIRPDLDFLELTTGKYWVFNQESGPGALWPALSKLIKQWNLHIEGDFVRTFSPPGDPVQTMTGSFDVHQILYMEAPMSEEAFALQEGDTEEPNYAISINETDMFDGGVIGTGLLVFDPPDFPDVPLEVVLGYDGSGPSNRVEINTVFGMDDGLNLFGSVFELSFAVTVRRADTSVPVFQMVFNSFRENPADVETGPLVIEVPSWDPPGTLTTYSIPLWAKNRTIPASYLLAVMNCQITMQPVGQSDNPLKPDPLTNCVVPFGESETSGDRTWNQDATAHRHPYTRALL